MKKTLFALVGLLTLWAAPAWAEACAASHYPWPGEVWDPETCYFLKPNADGSINVTASFTPSGTQDVNLKQIGGNTLTTTMPVSGTLTAVTTVGTITNPVTVSTHAVTQSGTWTVQPGNTANTTAWKVDGSAVTQPVSIATNTPALTVATSGGATPFKLQALTNTANGTAVKASAGQVYGYIVTNNNAAVCYLQFYNSATSITVGTAVVYFVGVPANGGANMAIPFGVAHSVGIYISAATTATGNGACTSGIDVSLLYN